MPNYLVASHNVCTDLLETGHTADHELADLYVTTDLDLELGEQRVIPVNLYEDVSFFNDDDVLYSHRFTIDRVNHEERLALEKIDNDIYNSLLDDANHHESRHKLYRTTTFILSGLLAGVLTYIWIK